MQRPEAKNPPKRLSVSAETGNLKMGVKNPRRNGLFPIDVSPQLVRSFPAIPPLVATRWRFLRFGVSIQKLTKRVVDAITSGDKTVIYYDSELTGFCLKVLASGGKRWCVEYRSGAGGRSVFETGLPTR